MYLRNFVHKENVDKLTTLHTNQNSIDYPVQRVFDLVLIIFGAQHHTATHRAYNCYRVYGM
jgi:hypothetical protein